MNETGKLLEAYHALITAPTSSAMKVLRLMAIESPIDFIAAVNQIVVNPKRSFEAIATLLHEGKKIPAIKLLREETGWSLKAAKDAVDINQADGTVPIGFEL